MAYETCALSAPRKPAERRQRTGKALPGRAWSPWPDITVGYGYRHGRAVPLAFNPAGLGQWLSYLLIAAGWVLATLTRFFVT